MLKPLNFVIKIIFFVAAFLFTGFSHAQELPPIDVIFDIDWTLTYDVSNDYQGPDKISVLGKSYRPADGAGEVIYALSLIPGIRVSFFSGENAQRNVDLLKALKMPDGRTAADVAYKILSFSDLTVTGDPSPTFSKKFAKDLLKVDPRLDLGRAVIVEDIKNFVPANQRQNVLWLGATYNFFDKYEAAQKTLAGKFTPPSKKDWALERNKLSWALGVIVTAVKESRQAPSSFVEDLVNLQKNYEGTFVTRSDDSQFKFYQSGLGVLRKAAPNYKPPVPLNEESDCVSHVGDVAS